MATIESLGIGQGYRVGGKTFMSSALARSYARTVSGAPSPRQTVRRTAPPPAAPATDPATSEAFDKAIAYYSPEGGYGKGVEAVIERGRTKAVAGGMQGLVSAGLAGTTMMGGLSKKYEEEVAMPARARVEETRAEKISGLEVLKAQITQGATEAARARALQTYLARLQSSTSLQLGAMRSTPSIVPARTPTQVPQRDTGGYVDTGGGYGSIADSDGMSFPMAQGWSTSDAARKIQMNPL